MVNKMKEIYFACGCFWKGQEYFRNIHGVIKTEVGYANGKKNHPNYEDVCRNSGHAETIKVYYNPYQISLIKLLDFFFLFVLPIKNKKPQYRIGIFYSDVQDQKTIKDFFTKLQRRYHKKIKIDISILRNYTMAEDYHQDYLKKHPFSKFQLSNCILQNLNIENKANMNPLYFYVTKKGGTEPPFYNAYWKLQEEGIYIDVDTHTPLFSSKDKLNYNDGWPCFSKPICQHTIIKKVCISKFQLKTKLCSKTSHNHLGYLCYKEGFKKYYCINSISLKFVPKEKMKKEGYQNYLQYL